MSSKALLETIRLELKQHRVLGESMAAVVPGNYGQEFMERVYGRGKGASAVSGRKGECEINRKI